MLKSKLQLKDSEKGFTLVELLVALSLLAIASAGFIPLFVLAGQGTQANRNQLVASSLANEKIEFIRSLPYADVGLVGGNPAGDILPAETVERDGITYAVETRIWWVDDDADGLGEAGTDPIPYDYKRVQVSVSTAGGFLAGAVTAATDIHTLVTLEGEEEAFPGGNILVIVRHGWNPGGGDARPVAGVRADLQQGPDAPQTLWTTETGRAMFAVLAEGGYTVSVDPSFLGMMVKPDQAAQPAAVQMGQTVTLPFEVEYPGHLEIHLYNAELGGPVAATGKLILQWAAGEADRNFTTTTDGVITKELIGPLWPLDSYTFQLLVPGYLPYDLREEDWDGNFTPGETVILNIPLSPANARIEVVDANSRAPVAGALVDIYRHRHTYDATAGWQETCAPVADYQNLPTRADGSVAVDLEPSDPNTNPEPPADPPEDTAYDYYCVQVSDPAGRYQESLLYHNAFTVINGTQATYHVALEPAAPEVASIRVKVLSRFLWWEFPKDGVGIRVIGAGYDEQQLTGAGGIPGEAFFPDLPVGSYTVQRRIGSSWGDPTTHDDAGNTLADQAGEYVVTYHLERQD